MIHYLRDPDVLQALADDAKRKCLAPDEQSAEATAKAAAAWEMGLGEQGTDATLDVLRQVIRQMGALPGQRTLILVSSGFIALTPRAMSAKTQVTDLAAQANVTVSALDTRGLDTLMFDMSNPWIEAPVHERERHNSLTTYGQVLEELASGAGGIYVHNSNDLEGGFKVLTKAPEYLYLLEFSPRHVKADGTYHQLKVKVDRKAITVRTREGYFAEKTSKETTKHKN